MPKKKAAPSPSKTSHEPVDRGPRVTKIVLKTKKFEVEEISIGDPAHPVIRSVVRHPGAVAVIPMVDDDHVCLLNNYRVAVDQTLIEIPAGTLEIGEDPKQCALRELREETGYVAKKIEKLHAFYLSPGILDERMHIYVATGLKPGPTAREHGEDMENRVTTWKEAVAMALDGRIADAKSIVAILVYDRLRRQVPNPSKRRRLGRE